MFSRGIVPAPESCSGAEGRIHALDSLRAVAMFLGILLHAGVSFTAMLPVPWAAHDVSTHWSFDLMIGLIHGFRMQLFFFLAGFFGRLLHQRLGTAGFARHRLKRVGLPFVIGMVFLMPLTLLIWVWGHSQAAHPDSVPSGGEGLNAIPTIHLWFLEYLLVVYALALAVCWLFSRLPPGLAARGDKVFDRVMGSPFRVFPFIPLTVLCLWNGPMWGEVQNAGTELFPRLNAVGYYALFFSAGWWLHRRRCQMDQLKRFIPLSVVLALAAIVTHGVLFAAEPSLSPSQYVWFKALSLTCASLYAWLMTFAMTGFFLRFLGGLQPWARYLADASYWCYLAHLPLVLSLQVVIAPWEFPAWPKFILLVGLTMFLLLVTYNFRVRYTYVGAVLHGPRHRPAQALQGQVSVA